MSDSADVRKCNQFRCVLITYLFAEVVMLVFGVSLLRTSAVAVPQCLVLPCASTCPIIDNKCNVTFRARQEFETVVVGSVRLGAAWGMCPAGHIAARAGSPWRNYDVPPAPMGSPAAASVFGASTPANHEVQFSLRCTASAVCKRSRNGELALTEEEIAVMDGNRMARPGKFALPPKPPGGGVPPPAATPSSGGGGGGSGGSGGGGSGGSGSSSGGGSFEAMEVEEQETEVSGPLSVVMGAPLPLTDLPVAVCLIDSAHRNANSSLFCRGGPPNDVDGFSAFHQCVDAVPSAAEYPYAPLRRFANTHCPPAGSLDRVPLVDFIDTWSCRGPGGSSENTVEAAAARWTAAVLDEALDLCRNATSAPVYNLCVDEIEDYNDCRATQASTRDACLASCTDTNDLLRALCDDDRTQAALEGVSACVAALAIMLAVCLDAWHRYRKSKELRRRLGESHEHATVLK